MDIEILKLIVKVIVVFGLGGPMVGTFCWIGFRLAKDYRCEVSSKQEAFRSFERCCDIVSKYYIDCHNKEFKEEWENKQSDLEPF